MGAVTICTCVGFGFSSAKCSSDISQFIITGFINGRPIYVGTFDNIIDVGGPLPSVECKVYWDGSQWVVQQTDPTFPEIVFFSTIDTDNICDLASTDWQAGDFTNFPCATLSLVTQLIDCPSIPCNCFETTIPENCDGVEIGYLDCSENIVSFIGYKNETYNFCSKIVPTANCRPSLLFLLKGECTNGQCFQPVTTTTTIPVTTTTTTFFPSPNTPLEPTNECDVITIFPMGVECVSIDPSFSDTFDGSASLYITGGTPPYEILWENGSIGTTINNLSVGEYKATVTDSYGDFLITSTCILSAETPTPTTTTSTTISPIVFDDLCMVVTKSFRVSTTEFIDFIYNGYFDGKPSWLSNDSQYFLYWNTGTTGEWLVSGTTSSVIYNPNPATPPLTGWSYLGPEKTTISVFEGSCSLIPPLLIQLSTNNPTCVDNGSIIVTTSGGIPPYTYSKDGGILFQTNPIFNNLGGGNYSIVTKDSTGTIQTQIVTLVSNSVITNYSIILNNFNNNLSVSITPSLPNGVSISFDLVFKSIFKVGPTQTSAVYNSNVNLLVNGLPVTPNAPIISNSQFNYNCNNGLVPLYQTIKTLIWDNIILNNTSTFSGVVTDVVTPVLPQTSCYSAAGSYTASLDNVKIQGCECCNVTLVQTAIGFGKGDFLG